MHLPMALHLVGLGQPAHGLKPADFFVADFEAGFALPYIMVTLLKDLTILRRFLRYRFWLRHKLFALAVALRFGFVG